MPPYQVLFVEDDPLIADLMRIGFEALQIKVIQTRDGLEALKLFEQNPQSFDVVITDYQMPNMNGIELCTAIREITPQLPVIMCSASSLETVGGKKADRFIQKPYDFGQLQQVTMELLEANEG